MFQTSELHLEICQLLYLGVTNKETMFFNKVYNIVGKDSFATAPSRFIFHIHDYLGTNYYTHSYISY
jgi:hypothetical protein